MSAYDAKNLKVSIPVGILAAVLVGLTSFTPSGAWQPDGRLMAMGITALAVWFSIVIGLARAGMRHANKAVSTLAILVTSLALAAGAALAWLNDTLPLIAFAIAAYASIVAYFTMAAAWQGARDLGRPLPAQ